jgi:hypothetical protein
MLNLGYFSPEFSTQKMSDENPFNDLVMVDGLIESMQTLPDNLQTTVKEERAK